MKKSRISNDLGIDLPMAVWLLQDGYNSGAKDAPPGELISVTTLLKPTRALILSRQVDQSQTIRDVSENVASRMGHALHDSIERAWTEGDWRGAMKQLNYPQKIVDRVRINPDPDTVTKDLIPIYLEKRGFRAFDDIILTGQLDFLIGSSYRDFKSTSTFTWTSGSKDEDFILQGSMYRWIFPELVTDDTMRIEFIFTDWAKYRTNDKKYPQCRVMHREYPLMSHKEVEDWMLNKINEIKVNGLKKQKDMIRCTDKELWRSEDVYKYYGKEETYKKGGRCTKNFDSPTEAQKHLQLKGKGIVVKVPGEPKACPYCPAFTICEQRKEMFDDNGQTL